VRPLPQRIHNIRESSTPLALAETGSKQSIASTRTQHSWRFVALASKDINSVVRPEDEGPQICDSAWRGTPPIAESTEEMPVGSVSWPRRS